MKNGTTRLAPRSVDESVATAIMREVALRLRREREDRDWTQTRLGQACGISVSVLCRVERFQREPSLWMFVRICLALRMRPSDVLAVVERVAWPPPSSSWTAVGNVAAHRTGRRWRHGGQRVDPLWRVEFVGPDAAAVQAQAVAWLDCAGTGAITVAASRLTDSLDGPAVLTICYEVIPGGPVAITSSQAAPYRGDTGTAQSEEIDG